MSGKNKITFKTKLLIYEYKERFPSLSPEEIANMFHVSLIKVKELFNKGEIIVPSKMNKNAK